MAAELHRLGAHEDTRLDVTRILVLRQSLGDLRCREVVEEVVFHLTERLQSLTAALEAGDNPEAQRFAARLAGLSEQVGLADFSRVARDLVQCLAQDDPIATGAVGARLLRLGEDSLFSVILYADQSAL